MLTAGAISLVKKTQNTADLVTTDASGGTGPYTLQWYKSQTPGFTPSGGNAIVSASDLNLHDTGMLPNSVWYYKVVFTDTGNSNVTVESAQFTLTLDPVTLDQNQFTEAPIAGQLDLKVGPTNVISAQISSNESGTLHEGQAVKIDSADPTGTGVPKVVACDANDDDVLGFIVYDIKNKKFVAGSYCELALEGSVMWLYAAAGIDRMTQVTLVASSPASVQEANTGDTIVGWALDAAESTGSLLRVYIKSPTFTVAP